jgi:hypothetical protein
MSILEQMMFSGKLAIVLLVLVLLIVKFAL